MHFISKVSLISTLLSRSENICRRIQLNIEFEFKSEGERYPEVIHTDMGKLECKGCCWNLASDSVSVHQRTLEKIRNTPIDIEILEKNTQAFHPRLSKIHNRDCIVLMIFACLSGTDCDFYSNVSNEMKHHVSQHWNRLRLFSSSTRCIFMHEFHWAQNGLKSHF